MQKYNISRESVIQQGLKMKDPLLFVTQTISPLLTLFVGSDNEWVMWSDEGYYNASLKGDRFIKWHVNQGSDKEALNYPVGRFKEKYYQSELFAYLLDGFTMGEALAKLGKKEQK